MKNLLAIDVATGVLQLLAGQRPDPLSTPPAAVAGGGRAGQPTDDAGEGQVRLPAVVLDSRTRSECIGGRRAGPPTTHAGFSLWLL